MMMSKNQHPTAENNDVLNSSNPKKMTIDALKKCGYDRIQRC